MKGKNLLFGLANVVSLFYRDDIQLFHFWGIDANIYQSFVFFSSTGNVTLISKPYQKSFLSTKKKKKVAKKTFVVFTQTIATYLTTTFRAHWKWIKWKTSVGIRKGGHRKAWKRMTGRKEKKAKFDLLVDTVQVSVTKPIVIIIRCHWERTSRGSVQR